jgi:hypothetical protein
LPRRGSIAALAAAGLALLLPATGASAKTKNGVTPVAPTAGTVVPAGGTTTFKARVRGRGSVFLHVCTNKKRDRYGRICNDATIHRMKRGARRGKSRIYSVRPAVFSFPDYWLNTPGVYYWQAYRIGQPCARHDGLIDCIHDGPVVRISVG